MANSPGRQLVPLALGTGYARYFAFSTRNLRLATPSGLVQARFSSSTPPVQRPSSSSPSSILSRLASLAKKNPSAASLISAARQFSSSPSSSDALPPFIARLEYIANGNPRSASAQYALYSACARFGRPDYIVQRYRTNQFATNSACDKLYMKALTDVYGAEEARTITASKGSGISAEALQGVGRAIGAGGKSGLAVSKGGDGSKSSPIHIMVEESWFSTIFKVVRFFAVFGFVMWAFMVTLQLFLEGTGFVKRISGQQNSEVRPELQSTRFSDVHGCNEAKEELQELVEFLKNPEKFNSLGGKLPKGVLLVGPPGTGKTLLARAVAGEAGVPFFYMSGSEFDEIYVGVGAKRVRELFNAARSKAPAIVFIDELDAIGGKRNERDATYAKQTLNQLLTDLDGFDQNSGVIFLAATNFPQLLDKALTRPGRFDRNVSVPLPDVQGRMEILKYHMRNIQSASDVDLSALARGTPGFSGAELENIVNQAAVYASKRKASRVSMSHLDWAKDRIILGPARNGAIIPQEDLLMTAYHEGGHALVSMYTPEAFPLYKATIVPRSDSLGMTTSLPKKESLAPTKREFMARLDVLMGGKAAEELVYGADSVTSGVGSDLQRATDLAYRMVTMMGMSESFGSVDLHSKYDQLSSETREKVWDDIRLLLDQSRHRAGRILVEHRKELDLLATALMEYEVLDKDEMEKVVKGEELVAKPKVALASPLKLPELLPPPPSLMPPKSDPPPVTEPAS